jgi:hypothetical protein
MVSDIFVPISVSSDTHVLLVVAVIVVNDTELSQRVDDKAVRMRVDGIYTCHDNVLTAGHLDQQLQ